MKRAKIVLACLVAGFCINNPLTAQEQEGKSNAGEIHGNIDAIGQYYREDSLIGAPIVPEDFLFNGFANLIYTRGNFEAGVRYETYNNVLQGFDSRYKGSGVPYRYARYNIDGLDVTVGNFYEQFGSGMVFRSYEERALGIDNAMDGVRLKYSPMPGLYLKGLVGKQRIFFETGPGIVRGFDGELILNEAVGALAESKARVTLGASFLGKYQEDEDAVKELPENVSTYGGRLNVEYGQFGLSGEYAYKINDPSSDNNFIYKEGQSALVSASYSKKGLGIVVSAKTIDNMSFRSDRGESINNLTINYLPALTKQHTYNLAATLYPYGTQPNGEVGMQADVVYKIPKKTKLGGKYGTSILINFSGVNSLDTNQLSSAIDLNRDTFLIADPGRKGYETKFFGIGDEVFFRDFNIEVARKVSKRLKLKASYINFVYNKEVVQGFLSADTARAKKSPIIYADIFVADVLYKINKKHAIRVEAQHLRTNQDQGNWVTGVIEYTVSPHWSFSVIDQYNYGHFNEEFQLHYPFTNIVYARNANRFTLGFGRQRAGIFCVGGVCRNVPASNGVSLSVTSSF